MKTKITALYERLSRDDDLEGESYSIASQKQMLEECAERNGFKPYQHFTDDGVTGARFDRPAFEEMMKMVDAGKIDVVIMKDLSRLGRDHLRSGLSIERFVENGVRFIAIGDAVDTDKGVDEIIAFRNIANEMYVRDASRKQKAAHRARGMTGKPTTCLAPFGYVKDPEDKHHWLVDPEAAAVVRRIYQLCLAGHGPYQICCILSAGKVEIPGYYLKQKGIGLHKKHDFPDPYRWSSSTVCTILKRKEYLGHTVNFKSKKNSYKDKKNKYVPEDEWMIFENTHEPIIEQEVFDNVQRLHGGVKRRPDGWGYVHPLTGLLFCADCGGKLYVHRINNGKDIPKYVCGNYSKYIADKNDNLSAGKLCESGHRIDAQTVLILIADTLKSIANYAKEDKAAFIKAVQETLASKKTNEAKMQKKRLVACEKRTAELEILNRKIYEDNALGKLPDKRFDALNVQYENEQEELERKSQT